jgi:biopolymer transport protein ExbB/TolQ
LNDYLTLINHGGGAIYVLLLFSVVSLAVIIEKSLFTRRIPKSNPEVADALANGNGRSLDGTNIDSNPGLAPLAAVHRIYESGCRDIEFFNRAIEREIGGLEELASRGLGWLATIGNTAPFVGLFGTVVGILYSFQGLSSGAEGLADVNKGIASALVATAVGLGVAIPTVMAYNLFSRHFQSRLHMLELEAHEVVDQLLMRSDEEK